MFLRNVLLPSSCSKNPPENRVDGGVCKGSIRKMYQSEVQREKWQHGNHKPFVAVANFTPMLQTISSHDMFVAKWPISVKKIWQE
jgi:hypothetical protein